MTLLIRYKDAVNMASVARLRTELRISSTNDKYDCINERTNGVIREITSVMSKMYHLPNRT